MGMSGIVIGLAPALGPTLSGYIIDNYHWRDLFGMVLPIVVLVLVLAFFLMRSVIPLSNQVSIFYLLSFQQLDLVVCFMAFQVSVTLDGAVRK